jgi:alpha-glucosidase
LRFWLDRGVDGFRFDTVNYFFHDPKLLDNPPDLRAKPKPEANPYGMQDHRFDKNRPETLNWLERIRILLDEYGAAAVGEVGEAQHAIRLMGDYTAPGRLQQCYSFEMLGDDYSPAFFRSRIEGFFDGAPKGWPMWAFSNHDVPRHAGRWASHGANPETLAKQACNLLLSFEGSICLWQGEELGQTDTDLAFEDLTDPQGIAFWPAPMGRDGTRTPMVWDGSSQGGFTTGTPWLPVKPPQKARNVAAQQGVEGSVLEHYRQMLAFRRGSPALRKGRTRFLQTPAPILAFRRETTEEVILCLFNLSADPQEVALDHAAHLAGPSLGTTLAKDRARLGPNAAAFLRVESPPKAKP